MDDAIADEADSSSVSDPSADAEPSPDAEPSADAEPSPDAGSSADTEPSADAGSSADTEPSAVAEPSPHAEPAGLSRSRAVATLMDDAIRVPGTSFRVGIDPIVGVLPVAGDLVMALLSLYIVFEGVRLGVGARTAFRMVINIALDLVVGSVPVIGDLFDAAWKANRRNVTLIERHVEKESA